MLKAGLENSFFPMEELSLIGFVEVVPRLPKLLMNLWRTRRFILEEKPDVIVTIDAGDFYFRLLKSIKKKSNIPTIHYNAPSVWATRPKRAQKISRFVDHLLCLLPFEPPYFTKYGMRASFVGHPIAAHPLSPPTPLPISEASLPLTILFGSRTQEIERLSDTFIQACVLLEKVYPQLHLLIPTFEKFIPFLDEKLRTSKLRYTFVPPHQKYDAFKTSRAALAASGTVALELAKAELPFVVGYKLHPLTYQIAKRIVRTPYICLVNIFLQEPLIAECIQENCTPQKLALELKRILNFSKHQQKLHKTKLQTALEQLKPPRSGLLTTIVIDEILRSSPTSLHDKAT